MKTFPVKINGSSSVQTCMSLSNNLVLSNVVHKAFDEVNEEGTEAAAVIGRNSFRLPTTFDTDHNFLLFIRHNHSLSILFAGKYSSPSVLCILLASICQLELLVLITSYTSDSVFWNIRLFYYIMCLLHQISSGY